MSTAIPTAPALIGRNIHKTFSSDQGEVTRALDDVSLQIQRGTLTALVGPDGAGKTTLLRLAAGLMFADSGELTVLGIDVAGAPHQVQARVGYMPQRFGLYEDLSVRENLDLYANLRGIGADERRERYPRLMEMTALGPFVHRLAGRLSGGMKQKLGLAWTLEQFDLTEVAQRPSGLLPGGYKQRLAMAAALLHEPEILFLDEPTSGADPFARREFWRRISALAEQGVTAIVTTHFMEEAEYCDRVVILDHGRVLAQGSPAEIRCHSPFDAERESTMEDAFIAIVEESRASAAATSVETRATA